MRSLIKLKTLSLAGAAWMLFNAAWAQTPASPIYTLEQLDVLMFQSSPAVRTATAVTQGAEAAVRTARTFPNPQLEVLNGTQRNRYRPEVITGTSKSYSLTQPLDMPWNRFPRIDAAQSGFVAAQAQERAYRADLRAQLRQAFHDQLRRQEEEAAAQEDRKASEQIRERVALRVKVGDAPKLELIKADAEMLHAQKTAQAAHSRTHQSRAALRAMVGPELSEKFVVQTSDKDLGTPLAREQVREEILSQSPMIASARALREQAQYQLSEQKALRMPQLSLRADLSIDPDYRSTSKGLAVTLPLWDWRGGPVGEAAARLAQSLNAVDYQEFALTQALDAAYHQYDISQGQVTALESGIVKQAEAAMRAVEVGYRAGQNSYLEVLDAQRVYRAARNELIAARYERASAWAEIERLRGQ